MTSASKTHILVFDHGTTSIRACLMNHDGEIVASHQQGFEQYYPQSGWVEHDPDDLWNITLVVAEEALKKATLTWENIAGIGITNQRETTLLWNKTTGKAVHNAIVWQCRRTADDCEKLKLKGLEGEFKSKTGLVLDPYFSGTKLAWLLDNVADVRNQADVGELLFGTVDTWVLWHLTGRKQHVTDMTNASRTLMFNIHSKQWDDNLLRHLNIPKQLLPDVRSSKADFGTTDPALTGGIAIPITGVAGDQQAALHGQKCWQAGTAKSTYGTGAFLVMNTGSKAVESSKGLLTTLATDADGNPAYALEGAIFFAGASLEWLMREFNVAESPGDFDAMAESLPDNEGVYLVPAFAGLGAPHWDSTARGVICGITQDTGKNHFVRAALEAMAFQTQEVLSVMQVETGLLLKELKIDGGVSRSVFLNQFMANVLDLNVTRSDDPELTAKGAGYLAGLGCGFWENAETIQNLPAKYNTVSAEDSFTADQREYLLQAWLQAIKMTVRNKPHA